MRDALDTVRADDALNTARRNAELERERHRAALEELHTIDPMLASITETIGAAPALPLGLDPSNHPALAGFTDHDSPTEGN